MLRRLLGTVLIVLGLAAAGLGVASATVWREPDSVVSTAVPEGDGTLVVTDPGVLELVGSDVTVVATVPDDDTVTVAVGRDIDVEGWVGIDHYTRVEGLTDWETLTTSLVEPDVPEAAEGEEPATPGVGANPAGNDMWIAEATGEGSVSLRWTDRPGRWSLIAASVGEDAQAPTIELTWSREPSTPWLWPGVGAGAALLVAGLLVLLVRRRKPRTAPVDGDAPLDTPAAVGPTTSDGAIATVTLPSRAELRAATQRAATDHRATPPTHGPADHWAPPQVTDDAVSTADAAQVRPSAGDSTAGTGVVADAEGMAGTAGTETEVKPALMSRRARRRATAQESGVEGPPQEIGTETPAVPEVQDQGTAAEQPSPPGRRWPFGGSAAPAAPTESTPSVASESHGTAAPAPQQVPGAPAAEAPESSTGPVPRLTRRELREQEEARRAAEQTGLAGRLRALTGSIPVVRPTQDPTDDEPTRASRAQAWRQAWGFDPEAGANDTTANDTTANDTTDSDTEGSTR